jgi:hypothetical protein
MPIRQFRVLFPPLASLAAISLVLGHAARYGVTHVTDEGAAAHLFQILMLAQLPVVLFFALTWLPKRTILALKILAVDGGLALAAFTTVFFLT